MQNRSKSFGNCFKTGVITILTAVVSILVLVGICSAENANLAQKVYSIVVIVLLVIISYILERNSKRKRNK
jgi:putative flippase GtrA